MCTNTVCACGRDKRVHVYITVCDSELVFVTKGVRVQGRKISFRGRFCLCVN